MVADWDVAEARARDDVMDEALAAADAVHLETVPDLADFLRVYFRGVAVEDLARVDTLDLLGMALSHRRAAERRHPGETIVSVFTPTVEEHGWSNGHTVVEVVTDDMPFLVDSVSAGLSRAQCLIHMVIHPVVTATRDSDGLLLRVEASNGRPVLDQPDAGIESWIHFDIDRESDPKELEQLRAHLLSVLRDVRVAVEDWPDMKMVAETITENLTTRPVPGLDAGLQSENVEFLRWLMREHFTFLGYREYDLVASREGLGIRAHPGTGLGILRDSERGKGAFRLLPEELQRRALGLGPLILTKANSRSTVHRSAYLDYVGVMRYDEAGEVIGEHRFLGLYTAAAYNQSIRRIPVLREKLRQVLANSGFTRESHTGKDLMQFLETYPRDELFQADADELLRTAMAVLRMQERHQTRVFVRRDPYGRFASCLVYLPRDRYTTTVRLRMESILRTAFNAESVDYRTRLSESVLARLHFVARVRPGDTLPDPDVEELQQDLAAAARLWDDEFADAVLEGVGEEESTRLARKFLPAIPEAYKEAFPARTAAADIRHLDTLEEGATELNLYRPYGSPIRQRRLKIYRSGEAVSLSRILPVLRDMGVDVTDERPFRLVDDQGRAFRIYDLGLVFDTDDVPKSDSIKERFEEAFVQTWRGRAEVDGLNALVVAAGLTWREVALVRALTRYARQAPLPFSREYVERVLLGHIDIVRKLVKLFHARFRPGDQDPVVRDAREGHMRAELNAALDAIASLDVDRILRFLLTLITSCVRTSYYQVAEEGVPLRISFKFQPKLIRELPEPRPDREIWVYAPDVEGVHLRFGAVARGGIRWSDRPEDFRTEILGLVKAQEVKNAVIVPCGAKGGFYAKGLPDAATDREAWQAGGRDAYRRFICGLLDLTDNRERGVTIPPDNVVRYDGDDPYLVVAADKGTAKFSDLANEVSAQYDFWLGDAFASGGSAGFDHKAMGITAKGAWESVKRHFREIGLDTLSKDFTCAGIGDMSGDVFGNGMLLSDHIRLVAAFDHRHVFLDPDPDPLTSLAERRRLFDLPRSSWADYDKSLLSEGGGVCSRSAKSVKVGPEVRAALGLADDVTKLTPSQAVRAILSANVDLLWNGGIGTYVKSSQESNADVGDKANDLVRIDGRDLRCRVIGEGGNLGLTQRGRIEAARAGVHLNTDAVDNSAGVDTSDHEVNIKILLDGVVRDGDLTNKQRDHLLKKLTGDVAERVLLTNYEQNRVLGSARAHASAMVNVHARMMSDLVASGELDRELEFLPSDEELAERMATGRGLLSPELSVLLAYARLSLRAALADSDMSSDSRLGLAIERYFPHELVKRFGSKLKSHPLAAQIVNAQIVNEMVNRGGISFATRLAEETSASPLEVVRGFAFSRSVFDLPQVWGRIQALDDKVPADIQDGMFLEARRLLDRGTRWWVQSRGSSADLDSELCRCESPMARLIERLPELLRGVEKDRFDSQAADLVERGVPEDLARDVAGLLDRFPLLDVIQIAARTGETPDDVATVYFCVSERYGMDEFLTWISDLPREGRWQALARLALRSDLYQAIAAVTTQIVRATSGSEMDRLDQWESENRAEVARVRETLAEISQVDPQSLATLSVALRAVRTLVVQAKS
ncbi:MAG: NAD-glutamate dehydrogenase [Candidatus Nanopelagicales bacterium]|nr:NAD-glutamate dehydrogenase [Candidatus Nanopelagicales bacterium]MDZ4249941.1 NAD-glutamate dehydrogenase [Candidatus Nanopelagicales bacterium]